MRRTPRPTRRTGLLAATGLVAGLMVVPGASPAAAVELGGDLRLSDMGPAGTPGYPALRSRVAYGSSRYLTVWEGGDTLGTKSQIHGQLVNATTGVEINPNDFLVGTIGTAGDDTTDAVEPDVAYNSTRGEFVVVYAADDTVDVPPTIVETFEIYAQRVSTSGSLLGSPLRVSDMGASDTNANFDARTPAVAYDATTDAYLVVWSGDDDTAPLVNNELEVYGQRLGHAAGGALVEVGANDVRLSDMGPDGARAFGAREPAVAWNPKSGEYLVAWSGTDVNPDTFPWQVFGQRVSATGAEIGADVLLGSSGDEAYTPAVTVNPSANHFLVVWSGDDGAANTFDIYGQLVSATGAEIGTDTRISNVGAATLGARTPAATWDASLGEYEVVWAGDAAQPLGLGDDDYEVFLARLTPTLGTAAATSRISSMGGVTTSTQTPDIAFSDTSLATSLAVWAAENQGVTVAGEAEVWGQHLAPQVDLAVTKTLQTAAKRGPGDAVQYRIVVTNAGPSSATGVRVSDTVPAAVSGVTATLPPGATSIGTPPSYVWEIPSLAPGASATITVDGVVASGVTEGQVVANTATVTQTAPHVDPNLGNNSGTATFTVDLPPSVTVEQAAGQADPTTGSPITFTATFSEIVTGFEAGDVQLGGTAGAKAVAITGSGPAYTVSVSGMTGDGTVTATIPAGVVLDSGGTGNLASTSTDHTVTYDTTAPTVAVEQAAGQADPSGTQPIAFTATFSEPVAAPTPSDVSLSGSAGLGSATVAITGGPTVYAISVSGITADGTVTAAIPGGATTDPAGNANSASTSTDGTVSYDSTQPTVSLSTSASSPTATSPIPVTATFSEDVDGFAQSDVDVANATVANFAGGPRVWTFDLVPTADGDVTADVAADVATDATGNGNTAASRLSVGYDATRPTVSLSTSASSPTAASPIPVTATFSEDVAGFTADDVVAGNATVASFAGGPRVWTLDLVPAGDGLVTADVAANVATDAAGNGNTTSDRLSVLFDRTGPIPTLSSDPNPTNRAPVPVTIQFDDAVTGFTVDDLVLAGGTAGGFVAVDGDTFTVEVTPQGDGIISVEVPAGAAQDSLGRDSGAGRLDITYDTARPSASLSTSAASPTQASPIPVTATFSEDVVGFAEDDIVVGNATVGSVAGGPKVYTFTLTPAGDGPVTADVPAGVATDAAGNGSTAAARLVVRSDRTRPTVSLSTSAASPTQASPIPVTATFSEDVTGFTADDVVVANAVRGDFAGGPRVYTFTLTPTGNGTVTADVAEQVATDAAGNGNTKAAQLAVRYAGPAAVAPVKCLAQAVSNGSKLKVTMGPSLPGSANYTFRLDVRRDGAWYRILKQYRTKGTAETRTVNVPKGTYRAKCYGPGFPQVTGAEAGDTVSKRVTIKR